MNREEIKVSEAQVNCICEVLKRYVTPSDESLGCQVDSLVDNVRLLRNFCVHPSNQDLFVEKNIPCEVSWILSDLLKEWKLHRKSIVCACQFMGNLVVGNARAQSYLWNIVYPEQIRDILQVDDPQIAAIISMIIYNCLKSPEVKIKDLFYDQISRSIIIKICESLNVVNDQDWVMLCIIEHFLQSNQFLPLIFSQGSSDCRCKVLDVILCSAGSVFEWSDMPDHFLLFLEQQFTKDCDTIDSLATSSNIDVVGTVKLLEILCLVTSDYNSGRDKLMGGEIIDIAVDILGRVHRAGKANSSGVFGLSQVRLPAVGAEEHNPVTGFKSNLVRVIGNLCYKNTTNQNKVRNLGGIELILDNFQLDDTNPSSYPCPVIRQWSICAIRNLCEDNPDNQGVVANFEKISASEMPLLMRKTHGPS